MTTITAWKAVRPDGTTRNGFSWDVGVGGHIRSDDNIDPHNAGACPTQEGDGLCLAKTWAGAASAGFPTQRCLVVKFDDSQVLGQDPDKWRVAGVVSVVSVYDAQGLLRGGFGNGADLSGADLSGANLSRADLSGADLSGANLSRADLSRANLSGANLSGADLYGADLSGADLSRADLSRTNLYGANLYGANLYGVDLSGANGVSR